ncbi:protein translocase subunit SecD [Streptomyces fractus]|uniref:protein translocase subunit SecD n=1 Tax=Streptomyces fractus TaxID=641806 RepID=UPI003CED456E
MLLITMLTMAAVMLLSGTWTPALGIDLEGGSEITLTASSNDPSAVTPANMQTAQAIIQQRVNGYGVSGATVQIQGNDQIVVAVPHNDNASQLADELGTTAKLAFRPILAEASASTGKTTPDETASSSSDASTSPSTSSSQDSGDHSVSGKVPSDVQQQFDTLDCSDPSRHADDPTSESRNAVACGPDGSMKYALGPVAVDGTHVAKATSGIDQQSGAWQVNLSFDSTGSKQFADITGQLAAKTAPNNQFGVDLDGQVISAPSVSEEIGGGQATITGDFTQASAGQLADNLSYGSLPLNFTQSQVTSVTPTVGLAQLTAGLASAAIGLVLVAVYCLLYYRFLGLVAIAGLGVAGLLTYGSMVILGGLIGYSLDLAGLCGAVVAIGITADSFIVYFERTRDALRSGRSLAPALAHGWPRARRTILIADTVTLLAAVVLYFFTIGDVQGFAFMLGLATVIDVATVAFFTRPLMVLLARRRYFATGRPGSGFNAERLGINPPLRRRPRTTGSD